MEPFFQGLGNNNNNKLPNLWRWQNYGNLTLLELDRHYGSLFAKMLFKKNWSLFKWNIHCTINLYQTIISPCYYSAARPFNFLEIIKFVKGTIVAIYETASPFMGQQFFNLRVHGSVKYHKITKGKLFWREN